MAEQSKLIVSPESALIESVADALTTAPSGLFHFLNREGERKGWTCSLKQRRQMYLHWLDPNQAAEMPAASLFTAIDVCGHGQFLDVLLAYEQRVTREARRRAADEMQPREYIRARR